MPSTYSPNLRIELIANGEQSGTWGNTTNVNLGTLIESAITGYVSITTGVSNYALTALDGTVDQSRNAIIVLNTSTGSPYNVFIPPVSKTYVVKNAAGVALTVYCSTTLGDTTPGGTGVVIPAGKTLLLYSTGINVTSAVNHFPENVSAAGDLSVAGNLSTAGNLSVTGALSTGAAIPVSSGGTGAASFNAYNLVRAGNTSTGALATLASGSSGEFLISNAGASAPSWSTTLPATATATTQAEKNATTSVATTSFVDRLRSLSAATTGGVGGTAVIGDRGALLSVTGAVTIPASVFSANDVFSIYNNTAGSLLITQGSGLTLRQVGTANTGNRSLAQRGLVTVVFISSTEAVISGGGLS